MKKKKKNQSLPPPPLFSRPPPLPPNHLTMSAAKWRWVKPEVSVCVRRAAERAREAGGGAAMRGRASPRPPNHARFPLPHHALWSVAAPACRRGPRGSGAPPHGLPHREHRGWRPLWRPLPPSPRPRSRYDGRRTRALSPPVRRARRGGRQPQGREGGSRPPLCGGAPAPAPPCLSPPPPFPPAQSHPSAALRAAEGRAGRERGPDAARRNAGDGGATHAPSSPSRFFFFLVLTLPPPPFFRSTPSSPPWAPAAPSPCTQ